MAYDVAQDYSQEFCGTEHILYSILNQTFRNFELIVINDGSTDDSGKIITSINDERIRYISTSNQGYSAASNFGIQLSQAEFIAKCDDDDIAHPERFQLQYEYIMTHNNCVAVGSWANWIDEEGRFLSLMKMPSDSDELKRKIPFSMPVPHAGSMYRKKALRITPRANIIFKTEKQQF